MARECLMESPQGLHPALPALPEGGVVRSKPSRLCLPGLSGKGIRVRTLALWLSLAAHGVAVVVLCAARLAAPLPVPPALVEVEFVELAGPKGGGGSPAPASLAARAPAAARPTPQAVPLRDPMAASALCGSRGRGARGQRAARGTGGRV